MRRTTILFSSIIVAVFLLTAAFTTNRVSTKIKPGIGFSWKIKKLALEQIMM
ncbi:MAG: hypothetical protein IPP43_16075 [Chitinophagaceae bacterium]|nr:hypothetical protein [Chitinophagaceae bacterium]